MDKFIKYNKPYKIKAAVPLQREIEEGNHEYKFKLLNLTDSQLNHRVSQLQWRLNESGDANEAIYHIGVEDNGRCTGLSEEDLSESVKTLQFMADQTNCDMFVRELFEGEEGLTAEVVFNRKERLTIEAVSLSITIAGDLDSGKSSMIGVLSSGILDNGKGLARTSVLTHNHEIESGRTSCVTHTVLHFDKDGFILNSSNGSVGMLGSAFSTSFRPTQGLSSNSSRLRTLSDLELVDETTRSVTLIDLAGHPKYLKTTVHGMLGRKPDYCVICVSVTAGIQSMTSEHIEIGLSLDVPIILVITKIDQLVAFSSSIVQEHPKLRKLIKDLTLLFPQNLRNFSVVDSDDKLVEFLSEGSNITSVLDRLSVPVFLISNVTGEGLPLIRSLLYQLPDLKQQQALSAEDENTSQRQNGNYIRVIGCIGRTNKDEDDDDMGYDDYENDLMMDPFDISCSTEDQLTIIEQELVGVTETEDADLHSSVLDGHILSVTDRLNIDLYKLALAELSLFVDLSSETTVSSASRKGRNDSVTNNSKILVGKVISGKLQVMDELYFGPTSQGLFIPVQIASIRLNNVPVRYVAAGQTATFRVVRIQNRMVANFTPLLIGKKDSFEKAYDSISSSPSSTPSLESLVSNVTSRKKRCNASGLVLMSSHLQPYACYEFEAEMLIMNHPSKIKVNYEPVIHVGSVRQCGKIISLEKIIDDLPVTVEDGEEERKEREVLKIREVGNGEKALIKFRFIYNPEYITQGETIIIREDRTKGIGKITRIF
jgi:GTPase